MKHKRNCMREPLKNQLQFTPDKTTKHNFGKKKFYMETFTIMISKVLNMICKVKIMTGKSQHFGQKVNIMM